MAKKVLSAPSKPQSLRVLIVEDSEDDALLVIRELKKGGYNPVYERVETEKAMSKALREKPWDIILCDYTLPKFSVAKAIALLKETNIDIPFLLVTGSVGEELAVECMRLGAQDYIMKDSLSRLCPAIKRELEEAEIRSKQKRAEEIIIDNEKRFKILYQESPIPTFTWQKKGDDFFLADCNRAAMQLTEGKASNYMGKSAQELYRKRPEIIDDMLQCFKEQSTIIKELVSQHFVPERLLSVYYSYITPDLIIVHMEDITDRKKLEETLVKERRDFKLIVDSSPIIVFYKDKEGRFIRCNKIFAEALNRPEEDFIGKTVFDFYSPQIAQSMTDDDQEVFQSRRPKLNIIEQYESASGLRWVQTDKIPIFDKDGVPVGLIGFAQDITERRQMLEALKESEENFRRSLDNSPLGVRIATAEGETLYANQAVLDMYAYASIDELRKTPLKERYTPESYADFQIRKEKRGRGEFDSSEYEISIVRKNGEIRHLQIFRKEIIWDGTKQFQIIYQDITEHKIAEEALLKSEEKYRNILESVEDGYYEVDLAGNLTFFNDSLCRINGYPREELMGMNNRQYTDEYNAKKIFQAFNEVYRTEKPATGYEYEVIKKDGAKAYIAASISVRKNPAGKKIGFRGIIRDITERKQAEEKLLKSEARYRRLVEDAQEGIYQSAVGYLTLNQALAHMLGYDSPEEVMATITDLARQLYVNPDDRKKLLEMVNEKGSITDFETEYYKKDGSRIWVSINMHAVRDEEGHLLYYQGINQDITEKKKIEVERRENIERLRKSLGATINAIAVTVETRDPYTAGHQRRVADLARAIATEMNLTSDQIDGVRMASIIHDIGKISIPSEILSKPTKLTDLEFSLIKTHSQSGYDILKDIEFPWPIARIVLEHHERIDGSGYPQGLKGNDILLESRIIAIADVVEAISSHRPYRAAQGLDVALAEISKNKGNLYEPDIVDACLRLFREKNYKLAA